MSEFDKALDILETILSRKATNLTAQQRAAELLYEAGSQGDQKSKEYFKNSLLGTRKGKDGKPRGGVRRNPMGTLPAIPFEIVQR